MMEGVQEGVGLPSRGDDEMPWIINLCLLPLKQHCQGRILRFWLACLVLAASILENL